MRAAGTSVAPGRTGHPPAGETSGPAGGGRSFLGRHWPRIRQGLTWLFFAAVVGLVAHHAREVDWPEIGAALRRYPPWTLALALGLATLSHGLYSTYDLIGRHQTGHRVPAREVIGVGLVSYAFNLNLGSLIGGVAFRYRLYSRLGLDAPTITRVLGLSLLTNWLGYLFVAGVVFLVWPLSPPPDWKIDGGGLRLLGGGLLAVSLLYLAACGFAKRRTWQIRGHELTLPPARIALLQWGLSSLNWMVIAATVCTLLQFRIDYPSVLGVLLVAAIAGVITHVPAGLGVIEVVFVTLLSHRLPQPALLAGLLAYRAVYYLLPLLGASLLFMLIETRARRSARTALTRPHR